MMMFRKFGLYKTGKEKLIMTTTINTPRRITGASLPEAAFRVHETNEVMDVSSVFEVLDGKLAAYRVRNFVPPDACRAISKNFWASPARVARLGEGEDGVEGYFIGASHYGKPTQQYLEESRSFESALADLYAGTFNPVAAFKTAVSKDQSICVRAAGMNGMSACSSKIIHWTGNGHFLLEPHDDLAQLSGPEQRGFEIQDTTRVLAVNIYVEVPPQSGQVQIWNVEPDEQTVDDLGLTNVGFPYPADLLTEYPSFVIPIETGDLCVFNGNLVHAVLRGNATTKNTRLLVSFFMMRNDRNELVWWT